MGLLDKLLARVGLEKTGKRSYDGARMGKLLSDWTANDTSPDEEIRNDLRLLRLRSRDLERNNDYARRFFTELETNVFGHAGMSLQMNVRNADASDKEPLGTVDNFANRVIEEAWWKWTQPANCLTSGDTHFQDASRLSLRTCARDGFPIIRIVRNFPHNPFRFALQLIEPDCLDHNYCATLNNGNSVKNGVEVDSWGRKVAYHLFTKPMNGYAQSGVREAIPADQIIMPFMRERIGQAVGTPWLASAITRLRHLGEWERAAVAHARAGACQMGFFENPQTSEEFTGERDNTGVNIDAAPLQFTDLPVGKKFVAFNPAYPSGEYDMFRKGTLKGIAAGMCSVAYHTLAQDLEGANYSSMRAGVLTEREIWMLLQGWWIRDVNEIIFREWLSMALLTGQIPNLPFSKFDKFNSPIFRGRRWKWVDPLKDITATIMAINNGLSSWTEEINAGGGDSAEVFSQLARDIEAQRAAGIVMQDPKLAPTLVTDEDPEENAVSTAKAIARLADGPHTVATLTTAEIRALKGVTSEQIEKILASALS